MAVDWSIVTQSHIKKACALYDAGKARPKRPARNTFLVMGNKRYPAKFIRGLAYKIVTGTVLNPSVDFAGGKETVRFFRKLDLTVEHDKQEMGKQMEAADRPRKRKTRFLSPKDQKTALKKLMKQRFGIVETEKTFPWMKVPHPEEMKGIISQIYKSLCRVRGLKSFMTPGKKLHFDFYIPSHHIVVEYDERQHFTVQRAISLDLYPSTLSLGFNKDQWRKACLTTRASDPWPEYRDEQRAFYDSLRDILSMENGIRVIRLRHGEYDWTETRGGAIVDNIFRTRNVVNHIETLSIENHAPAKVVSVCVLGATSKSARENKIRIRLLEDVVAKLITVSWKDLDCIIFPGGFFYLSKHLGHLPFAERAVSISRTPFSQACTEGCVQLEDHNPGVVIVAGVDSVEKKRTGHDDPDGRDQLCVAWGKRGILGIGRKIFPVGDEGYSHVCYADDFSTVHRIIPLPSGNKAVLCSCYDMFGISETNKNPTVRTTYIRRIEDNGRLHAFSSIAFRKLREKCIDRWSNLLREQRVRVGLAAIHTFKKPGRDVFWQRHGIATCSSGLRGGLAVGASHFEQGLPMGDKSTLTSYRVPKIHMESSQHRRARSYSHEDVLTTNNAIVRLFIA